MSREIDERVAREVMGVQQIKYDEDLMITSMIMPGSSHWQGFSPSTRIEDAWQVLEAIKAKNFWYKVVAGFSPTQPNYCGIGSKGGEHGWAPADWHGEGETMPLAICNAALNWAADNK